MITRIRFAKANKYYLVLLINIKLIKLINIPKFRFFNPPSFLPFRNFLFPFIDIPKALSFNKQSKEVANEMEQ